MSDHPEGPSRVVVVVTAMFETPTWHKDVLKNLLFAYFHTILMHKPIYLPLVFFLLLSLTSLIFLRLFSLHCYNQSLLSSLYFFLLSSRLVEIHYTRSPLPTVVRVLNCTISGWHNEVLKTIWNGK